MQERELRVGIGDMKFTRGTGKIITYALGSCIGISFWDPFLHLGALLHIMLPERHDAEEGNIYKYADSGIHETIRKLSAFGMDPEPWLKSPEARRCLKSEEMRSLEILAPGILLW